MNDLTYVDTLVTKKNDATKPRGIGGIALFRGKKPQEGDNNPGTLSSSAVNQSTSVEMGESVVRRRKKTFWNIVPSNETRFPRLRKDCRCHKHLELRAYPI